MGVRQALLSVKVQVVFAITVLSVILLVINYKDLLTKHVTVRMMALRSRTKVCKPIKLAFATQFWGRGWEDQIKMYQSKSNLSCDYRCTFTKNFSEAHALIFHGQDFNEKHYNKTPRSPHQYWIYLNFESPALTQFYLGYHTGSRPRLYRHGFNLTASYMPSSDITTPYGSVIENKAGGGVKNRSDGYNPKLKRHMAFVLVSNCGLVTNDRLEKLKELQKYMEVDIYGRCGTNKTLQEGARGYGAIEKLAVKYRFYLSFENSFCKDYVTEKYFNALQSQAIPVAFGGLSRKDYDTVNPAPKSYIYALDFESLKELAKHLTDLAKDENRYAEYFKWKRHYTVSEMYHYIIPPFMDKICARMQAMQASDKPAIADLKEFYDTDANCRPAGYKYLP